MFRKARIRAYSPLNIASAFKATGIVPFNPRRVLSRFTGTAAADPKKKKIAPVFVLSPIPATPSNTRAVRHMRQQALAEIDIAKQPKLLVFIDKLVNATVGGMTEGFLGQDRVTELEATLKKKGDDLKDARRRTKVTATRAITGAELLQKIRDLALNPPKTPKKRTGPSKKVTFSKKPKARKPRAPSPATIDLSSTSSESGGTSGFESECEGSTIHLITPGTTQTTPCPRILRPPTPAGLGLSIYGPRTQDRHSRVLRTHR